MRALGRQALVRLILTFLWCLPFCFGGFQAGSVARAEEVDEDFSRLKEHFEAQARQNQAPAQLSILGLETTAQAWALAAARLTEDPEAREEWRIRAEKTPSSPTRLTDDEVEAGGVRKSPANRQSLEERHSAALELYYQAFREVALYLVTAKQQKDLALDMQLIHRRTRDKLARLEGQPQRALEKRVVLSGALVALATVSIRSLGGNLLNPQMEGLVRDWLERTETLSRRVDLHYRARLQLLYIGNLRHLTSLVFILGRQAGPPLGRELAQLHGNLNLYGPKRGLPGAQSLIWAAQAQAAIPLAYWLSRHELNSPPSF